MARKKTFKKKGWYVFHTVRVRFSNAVERVGAQANIWTKLGSRKCSKRSVKIYFQWALSAGAVQGFAQVKRPMS